MREYLNANIKLEATSGTILFGGVDKAKYKGDLIAVPLEPDLSTSTFASFTVNMDSLAISSLGRTTTLGSNISLLVHPDSGTTKMRLPHSAYTAISQVAGNQSDDR